MASLQARKDFPRQIRELVAVTGTNEVTIKVDARAYKNACRDAGGATVELNRARSDGLFATAG